MANHIHMNQLSVHFPVNNGVVKAVDQVDLTMHEGEITGIIGESGCGKSVLGMALMGLLPRYAKTDGEIWFQEENLMRISKKKMRNIRGRGIGLIPQNPADSLNPVRKIKTQLLESIRLAKITPKDAKHKLETLLVNFGFDKAQVPRIQNAYPYELSGGMQQRVVSAMGIASNPQWILADEPSKGLDWALRTQLYASLELVRKSTSGMIIITHDLILAETLCDSVAVMYSGEIIEKGKNILKKPRHPYTQGLLNSLPSNGMKSMAGIAPSPQEQLVGCKFAKRCPHRMERCLNEHPVAFGNAIEMVRCFLYD
ncbi:ABC transporter ATP-binding protein [Fusibacter sp. 3D3]|uniref:ABC transporter ATP-binding protein n=1 Tax=Fusibacter sp. 3D3 TaxID=1048380 RepID=UPI000852F9F3|nr:ABC transporter ATP-binding protein [Fusibacter sp. 3D3]GAU76492.1 oligopeptide transport system permease protein OppB [Fusibacter sp. 3D3]